MNGYPNDDNEPLVHPSLYHHRRTQQLTNTPAKRLQPTAMSKKRPKRCVQTRRLGHRYVFLIIISCFRVLYTNYLYFRHEEGPKQQTATKTATMTGRRDWRRKRPKKGAQTHQKGPNDTSGIVWAIGMCFSLENHIFYILTNELWYI